MGVKKLTTNTFLGIISPDSEIPIFRTTTILYVAKNEMNSWQTRG